MSKILNGEDLVRIFDLLLPMTPADVEKCANPAHVKQRLGNLKLVATEQLGSDRLPQNLSAANILESLAEFDALQLPFKVPGTDVLLISLSVGWLQFLQRIGIQRQV